MRWCSSGSGFALVLVLCKIFTTACSLHHRVHCYSDLFLHVVLHCSASLAQRCAASPQVQRAALVLHAVAVFMCSCVHGVQLWQLRQCSCIPTRLCSLVCKSSASSATPLHRVPQHNNICRDWTMFQATLSDGDPLLLHACFLFCSLLRASRSAAPALPAPCRVCRCCFWHSCLALLRDIRLEVAVCCWQWCGKWVKTHPHPHSSSDSLQLLQLLVHG